MPRKKHPTKGDAKKLAQQYDESMVIVFHLNPYGGTMGYSSYGQTKRYCAIAQRLGDAAYDAIYEQMGKESQ